MPDHPLLDRHARQFRYRDLDPGHLVPAQIAAHDQRNETVLAARVAQHPMPIGLGDLDKIAESRQGRFEIPGLLRHDHHTVIMLIFGKRDPESVHNPSARRSQQPQIDAVLVGQNRVAVLIHYLQLVHSPGDRGSEQRLSAGKQGSAPG